jgi:hypothetical protein
MSNAQSWAQQNYHPENFAQWLVEVQILVGEVRELESQVSFTLTSMVFPQQRPLMFHRRPRFLSTHGYGSSLLGFHVDGTAHCDESGFCRVCEYAGFEGTPIPVEEWSSGISEEPIRLTSFAGCWQSK